MTNDEFLMSNPPAAEQMNHKKHEDTNVRQVAKTKD
jgi:hypothetical protein